MYPTRRNNQSISLYKLDFIAILHEVPKKSFVLIAREAPMLVFTEVCRSRRNKQKNFLTINYVIKYRRSSKSLCESPCRNFRQT